MKYEPSHRVRVVTRLRALGQARSASRVQTYRRGMPRPSPRRGPARSDDDVALEHSRARFGVTASSTPSSRTRETTHAKLRVDFVERSFALARENARVSEGRAARWRLKAIRVRFLRANVRLINNPVGKGRV